MSHIDLRSLRHYLTALCLCVIVTAVSFYFADGYYEIGEEKYRIFLRTASISLALWAAGLVISSVGKDEIQSIPSRIARMGALGWFIILFIISGSLSTLTSEYADISLWGYPGWHTGFIVQLLMIGCALMCMDLFANVDKKAIYAVIFMIGLVTAGVFVLGVINRFSIYPIKMYGQAEDFISTLGNINWFCGYWCVWTGVGCGAFLCSKPGIWRGISGVYVWICAVAGVCCGASSCYLALAAISYIAFLWALSDNIRLEAFCNMESVILAALPTVRHLGLLRPSRMWYDSAFLRSISYSDVWIGPFICGIIFFQAMAEYFRVSNRDFRNLRPAIIGISVGICMAVPVIIILNTLIEGGISPFRGMSLFTWGVSWGNRRGGIWIITSRMILRMFPFKIFFGVGCDCYCPFLYSLEDLAVISDRYMGNLYLTNAHNEILTMLVNQGILGVIAYAGIWITHIRNCSKYALSEKEYSGWVLGALLSACAYIAVGTVGFMQVLSTPFFFIVLGCATGLIKRSSLNIMR